MDPNAVVFDISSDEEVCWGENKGVGGGGDDFDWITDLLDEVDKEIDDSDDVVLVGEVVLNPKLKFKNSNAAVKSFVKDLDDDDDDCVVLDGDPEKLVPTENNPVVGDSDELLLVGEKGQVACRDFPHPRHLCAKFPFTSTPHETHCNQCHCYVCDSLAPCFHWGAGISKIDHCHATEKEEFWKLKRKCLKKSDQATIPVPKAPYISLSTGLPQTNQVPLLAPLEPNHVPQGQVPRPASIRACTMSTNFGIPNIMNQSRNQLSACVVPGNKFQTNLVSQQLRSTGNNVIPRDRRRIVGNLGPQLNSSSAVFKRAGSVGVALTSNRRSGSSNKYGSQYPIHPVATPSDYNSTRWQDFRGRMSLESNTYRHPSQTNMHTNRSNSVSSQPQVSSQPNVGSILVNSVLSQPLVSPQPNTGNVFVNAVTSQPQVPSQAYVGSMFVSSVSSPPQVSSQPMIGSTFANTMPSQSQVYSQPNSVSNDYPNDFQLENQNIMDASLVDIDLSWVTPSNQSSQQPPAETAQFQGLGSIDEPSSLAGFDYLLSGSTNPVSLDFQYDSLPLDNHPVSGALDVPLLSPEPAISDANIFFDY